MVQDTPISFYEACTCMIYEKPVILGHGGTRSSMTDPQITGNVLDVCSGRASLSTHGPFMQTPRIIDSYVVHTRWFVALTSIYTSGLFDLRFEGVLQTFFTISEPILSFLLP